MNGIQIAGGWGYDNLGDEVILASYLEYLHDAYGGSEAEIECLTVMPKKTHGAQRPGMARYAKERLIVVRGADHWTGPLLLGGGGYLNGQWRPEVQLKLNRLVTESRGRPLVAHGIELRRLSGGIAGHLSRRLFKNAKIAVRDENSRVEAERLGVEAVVLPDAVSLLYPHINGYRRDVPEAHGRVLLNLLDIDARGDSHEAKIDVRAWPELCAELITALGPRALGLVVGSGDRKFMSQFDGLELIEPSTVEGLVGAIATADALFSVRMHPALTASMLEIPVVAVPYCGKVQATTERIGVEEIVLRDEDAQGVLSRLDRSIKSHDSWEAASDANQRWLANALS